MRRSVHRQKAVLDGNIKGEYTGLKEITDEKERERSLNNWLLDLGW